MPVTSVEAACRRCHERFFLDELLLVRSGVCPRCGWRLTEDWVGALLAAATRARPSRPQLILALRRVQASPDTIMPLPHPIVRTLIEDVGWQAELVHAEGLHVADRAGANPCRDTSVSSDHVVPARHLAPSGAPHHTDQAKESTMDARIPYPPNQAAPPMMIVVATDGSDHSARALAPARRLAARAGADVLALGTGESLAGAADARPGDRTACFAPRRFGRTGVLRRVAEIGAPTLCIGPRVQEPPWQRRHGVLVCLDGTPESERALVPARRWATLLNQPITLVTVTAESRARGDGTDRRFDFGPLDPAGYLGALADELRSHGATASTLALTDRLSPASGLRQHLSSDRSALVVASTSSRTNLRAVLFRSVAAVIVDNSRVPVLLLPPVGPRPDA